MSPDGVEVRRQLCSVQTQRVSTLLAQLLADECPRFVAVLGQERPRHQDNTTPAHAQEAFGYVADGDDAVTAGHGGAVDYGPRHQLTGVQLLGELLLGRLRALDAVSRAPGPQQSVRLLQHDDVPQPA